MWDLYFYKVDQIIKLGGCHTPGENHTNAYWKDSENIKIEGCYL